MNQPAWCPIAKCALQDLACEHGRFQRTLYGGWRWRPANRSFDSPPPNKGKSTRKRPTRIKGT